MDYKYINQLLERYWRCETSVEEESILRAFFSQEAIPAELMRYQPLFTYAERDAEQNVLGDDFDEKLMASIEKTAPVKAHIITMPQRLKPLFKAAAVVAIMLTLGNAVQVPFARQQKDPISSYDGYYKPELNLGTSVAMDDSAKVDTIQQSMAIPTKKAQ